MTLLALALLAGHARAQAVFASPSGARLRAEALGPGVLRVWVKPRGAGFTRAPSLATEEAPAARLALEKAALKLAVDEKALSFSVRARDGKTLIEDARVALSTSGAWSLSWELAKDERLFGLGEDNQNGGRLDRRGTLRDLWSGQRIQSGNVTAQDPIPLVLGVRNGRAYGLFIDDAWRLRFDLGKSDPDRLRVEADGGELDLYLIDGPRLADVVERYTALTGRPPLPPLWALGYWQSRCTYWDWSALDEAYRRLDARGFPVDVMVIDADWPEVMTDYRWAKRWLAGGLEPAAKIADYAAKGVRIVMSQSGPMVKEESPTYASGLAKGVFAKDANGRTVTAGWYGGKLLDFTNAALEGWLWPQTRRLIEQGISGWWLDLVEPEGEPEGTRYARGPAASVHNEYALLCAKSFEGVQLAVHPDRRPFILSRCGPAGLQRRHAAVWTGDIYSDYATLRAHPPEMLNAGLSGLAWWTCDTGGFLEGDYKNDRFGAHAALYERWMQFSAFSPITRAHKAGGVPEPYALGPATEQGARRYLKQRYRLLPYIYSYAWRASRTGLPLVRPLALEFQDDPRSLAAPGDEYLFGRELLVAPVLHEGQSNRSVYFPPGRWIDWDYGYDYEGGRDWVVAAPQNRIPVAVRAGAIIPLAPDMKNTASGSWDPITLEVFPAGDSSFLLYRDDGVSFAYATGAFTTIGLLSQESAARERLTIEESNKLFAPRRYVARFHLRRVPIAVTGARTWRWDAETRVLEADLGTSRALTRVVDVALGDALPARPAPRLAAQALDPKTEAAGSGRPVPHFFPPPSLPAVVKAADYDQGGEGVAYHSADPDGPPRRGDGISLNADEWARYTVDAGNGGWFGLSVRAEGAGARLRVMDQDRIAASVALPVCESPSVYLNPGELTLMAYDDSGTVALSALDFSPAREVPSLYPAALARRSGVAEAAGTAVRNLGRKGSGLLFGVAAGAGGRRVLRLRYSSWAAKPVALELGAGNARPLALSLAPTAGAEKALDVPVELAPGADRVSVEGREDGWDGVTLDSLELVAP